MTAIQIPGLTDEDIGSLLNVRTYPQYSSMVSQILSGECPFCTLNPDLNKVIKEYKGWRLWENPFPHAHTRKHYVFAPVQHIAHLHDMDSEDWAGFGYCADVIANGESGIGVEGGGLVVRFGPPHLNAGSIRHLHANIIVPDGTGSVRVALAHTTEENARKMLILEIFEKMRLGTRPSQLSDKDWELVKDRMK